jgi:hypothetical protein
MKIDGGAIIVPRAVIETELWETKPAWWFKVWFYILANANFKDHNLKNRRGTLFTTYDRLHYGCNLGKEGIKKDSIDNTIRHLKSTGHITTQKTTRGLIITVLNYDLLQSFETYSNNTEYDTENDSDTTEERHDKGTNEINETNVNFENLEKRSGNSTDFGYRKSSSYKERKGRYQKKGGVDATHVI